MKTIKTDDIQATIDHLLKALRDDGLSEGTIREYHLTYTSFSEYLKDNDVPNVTEDVCLDYLEPLIGKRLSGLHEKPHRIKRARKIGHLYLLMNYQTEGISCHTAHRYRPEFTCPDGFKEDYDGYVAYLGRKEISKTSVNDRLKRIQYFINYLSDKGIISFEQLTTQHTDEYLLRYKDNALKYRGTVISNLKDILGYLYLSGSTDEDLRNSLPKLRIPRNSGIPHTWTKDELTALLEAVDREDPAGKRNYAIFLLTIHSGLRAGDVRNLRLHDINWDKKTVHVVMSKTDQPIDLPLLDKVGWAIIDYLKNGRPETKSDHVFVRHRAPFTSIRGTAALDSVISKCMLKAGVTATPGEHYGMHSLRSTLATNMLSSGAALSTISQTLGHEEPKNTEIYLKTNLDGLRLCAIDPDEEVVK